MHRQHSLSSSTPPLQLGSPILYCEEELFLGLSDQAVHPLHTLAAVHAEGGSVEEERHNGGDLKVGELVAGALAAAGP